MAAPFPLCISKFRNYGSGSLIRDSCLCEEAESGSTLRISGREKHFRSVAYRRLQCCASAFFPAGTDAFELAASVGPDGFVTGVDFSELLITEAVRRGADHGLPVKFEVGDAQALRFPDSSFDAVRTERMLMHVPDPAKALAEMARVLRAGGRMVVCDFDWESQFCDSPLKDTTRKIALSFCDGMKNGWIGRCLPRLFREVGMTDISVSFRTITVTYDFLQLLLGGHVARAVAAGILMEQEADLWWTHLAQANAEGIFLYGFTAFIVAGVKA